jgi:signal transduction histidine kinase
MQERKAGDRIEDYDKMIESSLARIKSMRNLIMDMLDLTRIESGKSKREIRETDLTLVAKSAVDTMIPLAVQRDVSINLLQSEPIPYPADTEEMEIVFSNLISNAVKYNVSGGKVNCSILATNQGVVIEISDTGVGIAADDIPKLFQEFSRIKNRCTKDIPGSGLGLSIVKRIVVLYKGKIEVESKVGEGSTFRITLP